MPKQLLPVLVYDTREQDPWFVRDTAPKECYVKRQKLKYGDYSIAGMEADVAIERKSAADACGTLGKGRDRFKRELRELAKMDFAAIIIETSLGGFVDYVKEQNATGRMLIQASQVVQSLIAFSVRYGIHVIWIDNRKLAARYAESLLIKFYNEKYNPKK
jgi:ERCC4-type nuclease